MGRDVSVARAADIIFCGFHCKPFTPIGIMKGFDDEDYGDNFELLVKALNERREAGIHDKCLIVENVPNILSFLTAEHLSRLGMHYKIFVVSGLQFRCANKRERLVLVGFLDKVC